MPNVVRNYRFPDADEAYRVARRRILNNALRRGQKSLDLSNYGLTELPPELGRLTTLQYLHLTGNRLTQIPDFIGNLTELVGLYASRNQITSISENVSNLRKLRSVDLEENQLDALPAAFGNLAAIQTLDVGYNKFREIPSCIFRLNSLKDLVLQNNSIGTIPDGIGQLTRIETLDLDNNNLSAISSEIGKLRSLEELHLRNNVLNALPAECGDLASLRWLDVGGNGLKSLPRTFSKLSQLYELDLSNNDLIDLPVGIGNLKALEGLDLSDNSIATLPDEIGKLSSLNSLNISNNALTDLPSALGQLTALSTLVAANNRITKVPTELSDLSSLTILGLSSNDLTAIPESFGRLSSLRTLNLNSNSLTALPSSIGSLHSLQVLNLENNRLTVLPQELGRLRNVERGALQYNSRTKSSVGGLLLRGNPLSEPYPTLTAMGQPSATVNVLAWLRGELDPETLSQRRSEEPERRLPADGPAQPQSEAGPSFRIVGGKFELATESPTQGTPGEVVQRALHKRLLRQLELLKFEAERFSNQYPELADAIFEYDELANRPYEAIDVVNLWVAGNALIAHIFAIEKQTQRPDNVLLLEPHQAALLSETARLHGGFILGFPEGAELTERADKALSSPDLIKQISSPTSEMLSSLSRQEELVSKDARHFAQVLESALHVSGWGATRAGYGAYATIRNFLIELGKVIVLFDEKGGTVTGGALISAAIAASGITPQTLELLINFLHSHSAPILAFAAPFPELRTWIQWIIDHLDGEHSKAKRCIE